MLRLPIQSIDDLLNELNLLADDENFLFKDGIYRLMVSSNMDINNNFLSAILLTNEEEYDWVEQSVLLIDMYSLSLIAQYSLMGFYDYIYEFIDGQISLDVYDGNSPNCHVLLSDEIALCTKYETYTPYMKLLCDKLSLLSKLKDITSENGITHLLIEELYGLDQIKALKEINALQTRVINEINILNNNYSLKH